MLHLHFIASQHHLTLWMSDLQAAAYVSMVRGLHIASILSGTSTKDMDSSHEIAQGFHDSDPNMTNFITPLLQGTAPRVNDALVW